MYFQIILPDLQHKSVARGGDYKFLLGFWSQGKGLDAETIHNLVLAEDRSWPVPEIPFPPPANPGRKAESEEKR